MRSPQRRSRRRGASGLTYALLVGLIATVAIGSIVAAGGAVNRLFGTVSLRISGSVPPPAPGRALQGPVLDQISTSAAGAWSTRRLRAAYSGPLFTVVCADASTRTVPIAANGGMDVGSLAGCASPRVQIWHDQSGSGRNLIAHSASFRPLLDIGAFGGMGGVAFDGDNDRLDSPENWFGGPAQRALTLHAVVAGSGSGIIFGVSSFDSPLLDWLHGLAISGGALHYGHRNGGGGLLLAAAGLSGGVVMAEERANGSTQSLRVDGVSRASSTANGSSVFAGYGLTTMGSTIGASAGGAASNGVHDFTGTVGEVFVFAGSQPNATEVQTVETSAGRDFYGRP